MTIIRKRAPTVFISVGMMSVDSWMNTPDDEGTDDGAVDGAEAAQRDGGEHDEQQSLPHVPGDVLGEAEVDAREGGEAGTQRSTRPR